MLFPDKLLLFLLPLMYYNSQEHLPTVALNATMSMNAAVQKSMVFYGKENLHLRGTAKILLVYNFIISPVWLYST